MSRYPAFLAGRCANGAERDRGTLTHLVDYGDRNPNDSHFGKALCGAEGGPPQRRMVNFGASGKLPPLRQKDGQTDASGYSIMISALLIKAQSYYWILIANILPILVTSI